MMFSKNILGLQNSKSFVTKLIINFFYIYHEFHLGKILFAEIAQILKRFSIAHEITIL